MGTNPLEIDALIVGAGFSGLYMLHSLRERGLRAEVVETAPDVGGTWYWNRYPGARCDVPSVEYSYSFSPAIEAAWRWSERYAAQPEILRYLQFVADFLDLRRDISFGETVVAADWDADAAAWNVQTDRRRVLARHLILATGNLSVARVPDWPGIGGFAGALVHTAKWPEGLDVTGRDVGVIGTGSSGVQVIPALARKARTLTVFQRTPSFVVPAGNRLLEDDEWSSLRPQLPANRAAARRSPLGFFQGILGKGAAKDADPATRDRILEESWNGGTAGLLLSYGDILFDRESNAIVSSFAARKIAERIHDAETARKLTPSNFPIGARRLVSEIGFFDAMNEANVRLVDVREEPVTAVETDAVVTRRARYPIDVLVCATGFDAITGAIAAIRITGRDGQTLGEAWARDPRAYLGLCISGFPNLFTITGVGSPSVFSNMVVSIEQHVEWIADCLQHMTSTGARSVEADADAEAAWMQHVHDVASQTLLPLAENSWYHGRTRQTRPLFLPYVGGVGDYRQRCDEVVRSGYRGFHFETKARQGV